MQRQNPRKCFPGQRSLFSFLPSAAACVLAMGISGCSIPQLCCPTAGPALPEHFREGSAENAGSSAELGIFDFFDDPVLTQLLTEGLAQNQELKIRNQEVLIARNEVLARRGAYLPFVDVRARGGVEKNSRYTPLGAAEDQLTYPGGGEFPDPLPNVALTANMLWRIDLWREFRNARDAAQQRYIAAVEDRNYLITRMVAETAENYYELAALDKRLAYLDQTIKIQERSLEVAQAQKEAARGTELGVLRFRAEVRRNESQRMIVQQTIIETENRINFRVGRYPQQVNRKSWDVITFDSRMLSTGVPAQLLLNRRDIRAAEREVAAAGLEVLVARAAFFPRLDLTAGVGFEAFSPRYLFNPEAFVANAAGELVAPLINKKAIQAEFRTANSRQLQAIYEYQRTVLNAYTEVVNQISRVENYRRSVAIKQQQVTALEESVNVATDLFLNARAEYPDVLFTQRDLLEARMVLIETKLEQLTAIVNAYQALGGGYLLSSSGQEFPELFCFPQIQSGEVISAPAPEDAAETPPQAAEDLPVPPQPEPANDRHPANGAETPLPATSERDSPSERRPS
jgi:multidrug efflux system outer membrane protein